MRTVITKFLNTFLGDEYTLKGKIFNTLALAGAVIGTMMTLLSIFTTHKLDEAIINLFITLFSVVLITLHIKYKNYKLCSTLTIFVIFLIGFPALFFGSDGYTGGMPSFFVFAIVFTVYLIEGKSMFILVALQYTVYISICFLAYYNPDVISMYRNEHDLLLDIIIAFVSVSLILGATMFAQFRMYTNQQKQLEIARAEAERANKAKSAFLANMSHEIRTPIGIILGTNEIIARDGYSRQVREQAAKIKNAGELLDSIVNNVLDFVKIEAGKTELVTEAYSLSVMLNEIEQYGKALSRKKGLSFMLYTDIDIQEHLVGDPLAIKQVMLNIINNAVKYTDSGGVSLQVKQKTSENPNEIILHFIISDTGIGIGQGDVDEIFDSFKRIDRNSGRYVEGVGLGLSIVKQLLSLMHGDIEVVSILGTGSDFKVYIPQTISPSPKIKSKISQTFIAPTVKILVVDDNDENLLLIKSLLERTAMKIDTAQNYKQCVELLQSNSYDVILMDYMMPEMNGIELLKSINESFDITAYVIAVTANAVSGTKEYLLQNGFSDYLTKPVSWETLESTILQYIPPAKYRLIELEQSAQRGEQFAPIINLREQLDELGVDCDSAIHSAGNNYEIFCKSILIYLTNLNKDIQMAKRMVDSNDFDSLYYVVHSLKSRAKGVGAYLLHHVSEEIETLFAAKKHREIKARMPYLFYLWENTNTALVLINKNITTETEVIKDESNL